MIRWMLSSFSIPKAALVCCIILVPFSAIIHISVDEKKTDDDDDAQQQIIYFGMNRYKKEIHTTLWEITQKKSLCTNKMKLKWAGQTNIGAKFRLSTRRKKLDQIAYFFVVVMRSSMREKKCAHLWKWSNLNGKLTVILFELNVIRNMVGFFHSRIVLNLRQNCHFVTKPL